MCRDAPITDPLSIPYAMQIPNFSRCRHCFEVATPDATFFMYADTEKQKDEWIGAIGRAIVKFSGAFTEAYADESSSDDDSDDDE